MKRIFHHVDAWECIEMYKPTLSTLEPEELMRRYAEFLRDTPRFQAALGRVIAEWPISCEQFLTNDSVNRVAWLGQASMCIETGISREYRGGFKLLTEFEQALANATARRVLEQWLKDHA